MPRENRGVFPDGHIAAAMQASWIRNSARERVNPASLDLIINPDEVWRIDSLFRPLAGQKIWDAMKCLNPRRHDLKNPLERDVPYMANFSETIALPDPIYGYSNAKSTSARNGMKVRLSADGVPRYDTIPRKFRGSIWASIMARHMPVIVGPQEALLHLRIFDGKTTFGETEMALQLDSQHLLYRADGTPIAYKDMPAGENDGSLLLGVDLSGEICGWECKRSNRILDLSRRDHDPFDFFEPVRAKDGCVDLGKGHFYIFRTSEYVRVPPGLACEMRAMDERAGDVRVHDAGFIDPGWGCGKDGKRVGQQLVMEVTPAEGVVWHHGEIVAKIRYECMIRPPDAHYGELESASYQVEAGPPSLAKQFKRTT